MIQILLFFIGFTSIGLLNAIPFCDVYSLDNVFNVGHQVHMSRCGEVWTWDPRIYEGAGGFLRDFAIYTFARKNFAQNIVKVHKKYDNKYLRFGVISFQEVNCLNSYETLDKDCGNSVVRWNGMSVMFDNFTAVTFQYDTQFKFNPNGFDNPLAFKAIQDMSEKSRNKFWPKLSVVADRFKNTEGMIHSGLFDVRNNRLYVALLDKSSSKYYCITHMGMEKMLHSVQYWPTKVDPRWAKAYCFTGNLVGMFIDKNQAYVVGRVKYDSREYEDQVYKMNGEGTAEITVEILTNDVNNKPHNLRTYFGCRPKDISYVETHEGRVKRSVEESDSDHNSNQLIVRELVEEFVDNWILLSLLLSFTLILIYVIIHYSLIIRSKAKDE